MVAISRNNYSRKKRILELTLIEGADVTSDSDSIDSGCYEDEVNEESENVYSNEPSPTLQAECLEHQPDSLLQSSLLDSETSEDEKESRSQEQFTIEGKKSKLKHDSISLVLCDAHQFDPMLDNPIENLDSSSEEDENSDCELDSMADDLMELIANSNPEETDEEGSAVSDSTLQESNFKFKETETLDEVEVGERVERAISSSESAVTVEVTHSGDSFVLNSPDLRPQTFIHQVDRETFHQNLETVAEVNQSRLNGWQGKVAYACSKRGGLRECFSKDMTQFKEVHKKSVRKLFQRQEEELDDSGMTERIALKPKLPHYQDFIALRPSMFDPEVVSQLLESTLGTPAKRTGGSLDLIDGEDDSSEAGDRGNDVSIFSESDREPLTSGSSLPSNSSFDENQSMPLL